MFRVIVYQNQTDNDQDDGTEIYSQTVEVLDLKALLATVNKVPRKPRVRKEQQS